MKITNKLRFFDITMMVISLVIGMGIFRAPATVALRAGNETLFYAAWILGGIIAMCGALGFAAIGRRMPVSGAYYRIFAQAFHPSIAFAINILILVSNAASSAGVAIIGAEYISAYFPGVHTSILASIMIIALFGVNLLGLRTSANVQNILIGIKVIMLLCVISAIGIVPEMQSTAPLIHNQGLMESFGLALIAVSFTYGGYQQTINFGGDIVDKGNTLPKAIILGVIIIISLYLCANAAYVHVIGFSQLAQAKSIAAIVVQSLFGNAGSLLLSAVLVISVFGYINVSMLSNPRVLQAMSEDGVLPKTWAKSKAEKGVHVFALIIFTLLSIICVFAGKSFETILNYTIFLDSIGLAVGISTLYRLKGEKISPLIHAATGFFIMSCLYTSCNIFIFDTQAGLYGSALFAAIFICGWFITKKSNVLTHHNV